MTAARLRPATEAPPVLVVAFTVDGEPQAWQRVRYNPRSGRMFNSDAMKAAEAAVAWECKQVVASHGLDLPYAGEVALIVRAYSAKTRTPDLDNVVKLVSDALNKVAWVDDHQVKRILATMATDANPRTVVEIITEGNSHDRPDHQWPGAARLPRHGVLRKAPRVHASFPDA